jgi:hypothetical protein
LLEVGLFWLKLWLALFVNSTTVKTYAEEEEIFAVQKKKVV